MTAGPQPSTLDPSQLLAIRRALNHYGSVVHEICPGVPRDYFDIWTLGPVDTLAIFELLTSLEQPVAVFDVGTFVGGSAFAFASHPAVTGVVSIDPNPPIADEINDKRDMLRTSVELSGDANLRVLDVAAAALARFPAVAARIELRRGHLGASSDSPTIEPTEAVPLPVDNDGSGLVVFIDGNHTSEAVHADLTAAFSQRPDALAILDDCRYAWGPFVQAGVARFLEDHRPPKARYRFRLVTDLVPSLSRANLGLVHQADDPRLEQSLEAFSRRFSGRMDLLRLLEREDELVHLQSATSKELKAARERALRLSKERDELAEQLEVVTERAELAHERVADLEQSTSWRVTAPLRRLRGEQAPHDPR